jgi:aminoglycoside 3-N-acetyltransferase I
MNTLTKNFQLKRLGENDLLIFQKLIQLFQKIFEPKNPIIPSESYLKTLLQKSGFVALVILHEDQIVGGLTAYELPMYYGEYSELYLYDIAVASEFQRKGLGKELLLFLKKYCKENNIKEFFVEAHEEDKHAINFYNSNGGKAERVIHFNFR